MSQTRIIMNTAVVRYSYNPAPERPPITKVIQDTVQNIMLQEGTRYERPEWCRRNVRWEDPQKEKIELDRPGKEQSEDEKPEDKGITVYDSLVLPVPLRGRCNVEAVDMVMEQVTLDAGSRLIEGVEEPVVYLAGSYIVRIHCLSNRLQRRMFYHRQLLRRVVPITISVTDVTIESARVIRVLIEEGHIYMDVEIEVKVDE